MVFHLGTSFAQNAKMSVMSRIDCRGGKMYSFCAMNSLRMSFWIVPDSVFQSAPCCSATTRYIAKIIGAGELIVIDVVMLSLIHISEPTRLLSISYAVFCLKKKKNNKNFFFFLMIRRPPRSTLDRSSAASDVYKRQQIHRENHRRRRIDRHRRRDATERDAGEQSLHIGQRHNAHAALAVSYTHLR